ncbi:MAG: GAF domain-containing protein [Anaerolineales bacterium]
MDTPQILFIIASFVIGIALVVFAVLAWRRRHVHSSAQFIALLLTAGAVWAMAYAFELVSPTLPLKTFWTKATYLGSVPITVSWFFFALNYSGRRSWLESKWIRLIFIVPVITLLGVWTYPLQKLYWTYVTLEPGGALYSVDTGQGPLYWVHHFYSYLLVMGGIFLMAQTAFQVRRHYRIQTLVILGAVIFFLVRNILFLLGFESILALQLFSGVLTLGTVVAIWVMYTRRFPNVVPVARSTVVESMDDAVVVLDEQGQVADFNIAARKILKLTDEDLGLPVEEIFADHPRLLDACRKENEQREIRLGETGEQRSYELRLYPFYGRQERRAGRLMVLDDITAQKRTEMALRRQLEELQVLHGVAIAGAQTRNEGLLIEQATALIGETLYTDSFGVLLVDEEAQVLRAHPSYRQRSGAEIDPVPLGEGIAGSVAVDGRPRRVGNVLEAPSYISSDPETRSELSVPLQTGERIIGIVNVESVHPNAFTEADERLLITFAGQLATAIERARLSEAEHDTLERIRALYEVASSLIASPEPLRVLDTAVEDAARALGADHVVLAVNKGEYDPPELRLGGQGGMLPPASERLWHALHQRVLQTLKPERVIRERDDHGTPLGSMIVVPLSYHGAMRGTLSALKYSDESSFTQADQNLLEAMANQIAVAVENAHLFKTLEYRVAELQILQQTSLELTASLELSAVLERIAEHALSLVKAYTCSLYLFDAQSGEFDFGLSLRQDGWRERVERAPRSEGLTMTVVRQGEPLIISDVFHHFLFASPEAQALGLRAIAGFPLTRGERVLGVLTVSYLTPHTFTEAELRILGLLASQAAIAIENAHLFEETERLKHFNENIVQGVAEAILIENAEGHFVFANPAGETLLGYGEEDLVGMHWKDLVPPGEYEKIEREWQKREKGVGSRYETVLLDRWGQEVPVIISARPLFEGDAYAGVLVALMDITERKAVEEERERLIRELDAFAHTVAHDLKTPLNALLGSAEILHDEHRSLSPKEMKIITGGVEQSVSKMLSIIDELLLLASVRKQQEVQLRPLEMGHIVGDALERLHYVIKESDARIEVAESWPQVRGYGPWVEEVWVNYISNAIKYGGEPPEVELGFDALENDGVRFWVRDNGQGIAEEAQHDLFTPFTRLGQVHATGSGLGLSIARRIVERLGGEVGLESAPGEGSRFWFTLPPASDDEPGEES